MKITQPVRQLLLLAYLLFSFISNGQPPKIISGVFIYDILQSNYHKVSSSGNSVALKRGSYQYVFYDIKNGKMIQADKGLPEVSSDHRYLFESRSFVVRKNERDQSRWAWQIKSIGISSDTIMRTLVADYYALDIDEKGNFIATKIWYDSSESHLSGMKGVYKIDRITGKPLQTLRDDTLFICKDRSGCPFFGMYLQKNYLAFSTKTYTQSIDIYPFGETRKITIPGHSYHTVKADSLILFTIGDSTLDYRHITAFDIRTGQLLAHKRIDRPSYTGQLFQSGGNKMYILQYGRMIEELTPEKTGFTTTKTWDIALSLGLSKDQFWDFTVLKGPSFFVAPASMTKGEAGGVEANTAHFLQGISNKVTFQVYPFYNRTPQDVAKHEKDLKAQNDFLAKIRAEKDSLAHPERYCHHFWNTQKHRRGLTIFWGGAYYIMADYDCKNDEYKIWRPSQLYNGNGHLMAAQYVMVSGGEFRSGNYSTSKFYQTCTECEGDGTYEVTVYTTKTKDLPWGYFSGIETKKITTTSTTMKMQCKKCLGNGVELMGR